ncbi:MAG: hypothetical protein GEU73_05135 [Chloroflexi bacterium]|nr:hypothetical protein [Chloroflexota bacterium]
MTVAATTYLEFGRVMNDSGERFLSCTHDLYDEAEKGLSGDKVHIIRIAPSQLPWLAKEVLRCLSESEFDAVMHNLETEAAL